jgi:hypothetical protein
MKQIRYTEDFRKFVVRFANLYSIKSAVDYWDVPETTIRNWLKEDERTGKQL